MDSIKKPDGIILPVRGRYPAHLGPRCVMAAHPGDAARLAADMQLDKYRRWLMSRLYFRNEDNSAGLVGPFIGAPYAVILLEAMIAWGVREIILVGWCGALSDRVHIGDVVIPDSAFIDEGTSLHYSGPGMRASTPSPALQDRLARLFLSDEMPVHHGPVWTTDAIYRETPDKIAAFQRLNALGVDMETSALFSAAAFRKAAIGCVLIVSDELSGSRWIPGFKNKRFLSHRKRAAGLIARFWS